jgi:hypothetical protein
MQTRFFLPLFVVGVVASSPAFGLPHSPSSLLFFFSLSLTYPLLTTGDLHKAHAAAANGAPAAQSAIAALEATCSQLKADNVDLAHQVSES